MKPEMVGRVPVFGERGQVQVALGFIERVGELAPARRRLALAWACTLPWERDPDALPDSFRRELELAAREAQEEDRSSGAAPPALDTEALLDDHEPPINEVFLRQPAELAPAERRAMLLLACMGPWIAARKALPEWLDREHRHARAEAAEERQRTRDE